MIEHVFSKECKQRGFVKKGKSYMRTVGDGVFQHILTGFKEHLDPSAPGYSGSHRYEPRIYIYLKSMYAQYDGLYISIDNTTGFSLAVSELVNKQKTVFMGTDAEMEKMLHEGLDILDTITTQHQIIEYLEQKTYYKCDGQHYSTQLYDIYLYSNEFYKARMSIETEFAENYFSIMSLCQRDPDRFYGKMCQFQELEKSYYERFMLTFPVQRDEVKKRLQSNYKANSCRLKDLGIYDEGASDGPLVM